MADIFNMLDTWNAGATVFTGIKLNVTDTASAAGSLLMDLQVGGVSQFKVSKAGAVTTPGSLNAGVDIYWTRDLYALSGSSRITWSGNLSLYQDAANTLAQRNGVNAQAFNLYNTYTDASNYERFTIGNVSGERVIGFFKSGTGSARSMSIGNYTNEALNIMTNADLRWQFTATGTLLPWANNTYDIGTSSNRVRSIFVGSYTEVSEMTAPAAPATNNVRIYAEDDGSGKTRLMARFATGAAVQIAIEP